ncbi:Uncharacterised protein [Legionella pneumophila]|nr:Uncharacterised protein [Legionella pneumophila]
MIPQVNTSNAPLANAAKIEVFLNPYVALWVGFLFINPVATHAKINPNTSPRL